MNGLPSIIIGLFIFGLLVNHRQQSGFAASVALAIIEAAADRPRQPGGAAAGPRQPARSGRRARREPLAHGARNRPAQRARRNPHLDGARRRPRRGRDRAADLRHLGVRPRQLLAEPVRSAAKRPGSDLLAFRRSQPGRLHRSLGPVADPDLLHPLRQPRGSSACLLAAKGRWPGERRRPDPRAAPRPCCPECEFAAGPPPTGDAAAATNGHHSQPTEVVFDAQDVSVLYGAKRR